MIKVATANQIREADQYTILHEPIASIDLMERAAEQCFGWYINEWGQHKQVVVYCGTGNNGGDGLALARMLLAEGYLVRVVIVGEAARMSPDCRTNYQRYQHCPGADCHLALPETLSALMPRKGEVVVDALFGTGINRPAEGLAALVIEGLNQSGCPIVSIDLPSGLSADWETLPSGAPIVRATATLTLGLPKPALLVPDNAQYTGHWILLPIGLNASFIARLQTVYTLLEPTDLSPLLKPRPLHSHKGTYGHGLLMAGSLGMAGAAVLAARAAYCSGLGLLTVHSSSQNRDILQISVPEAIFSPDRHKEVITKAPATALRYNAIAIGPGIGTSKATAQAILSLIRKAKSPMVIDADGLNILARQPDWPRLLPPNTILTPHPGEFDRLFGPSADYKTRLDKAQKAANEYGLIIVLKGYRTAIILPSGEIWFNTTGNAGMATAGSGDVLTGIVLSLLAQGYNPPDAARMGVFVHGLAGDWAANAMGETSLTASNIVDNLPQAFKELITTK